MEDKKRLKSSLKRKVRITEALLVAFCIAGNLAYAQESSSNNNGSGNTKEDGIAIGKLIEVELKDGAVINIPPKENGNTKYSFAEKGTAKAELASKFPVGFRLTKYNNKYNKDYETMIGATQKHMNQSSKARYANTKEDDCQTNCEENKLAKSIAIGSDSVARNASIAIGDYAFASRKRSDKSMETEDKVQGAAIAIGSFATATAGSAISLGAAASAQGSNSIAIGRQSAAVKETSIAIGKVAAAAEKSSIAIGNGSVSEAEGAVVLGAEAKSTLQNSVALGESSSTNEGSKVSEVMENNITYNHFAGALTKENMVVSFGKKDNERQLQHVAAGKISSDSTDAINGSQLYSVIKNASWTIQNKGSEINKVHFGDTVNFIDGDGTTAEVTKDSTITDSKKTNVKYSINTVSLEVDNQTGKVSVKPKEVSNNKSFATAEEVAKAINESEKSTTVKSADDSLIKVDEKKNTTKPFETEYAISLGEKAKKTIEDVTTKKITVTGGEQQADSFTVAEGGEIKVISTGDDGIVEVGADASKKAITVGIDKQKFDDAVTKNKTVQENVTNIKNNKEGIEDLKNNTIALSGNSGITNSQSLSKQEIKFNIKGDGTYLNAEAKDDTVTLFLKDKSITVEKISDTAKGKLKSGTLDVTGEGNTLGKDIKIELKENSIHKKHLSDDVQLGFAGNSGSGAVKLKDGTFTIKGENGIKTNASDSTLVVQIDEETKKKIDNAADTNLSNVTNEGKKVINSVVKESLEWKAGTNVANIKTETSMNTDGTNKTTYTLNAKGTTVSSANEKYVSVTKDKEDSATNVTNYKVDLSEEAKTKMDSIGKGNVKNNDEHTVTGKTVHEYLNNKELLSYKANGTNITGTDKVSLTKGLNFVNGTNTTASIEQDGVVKYSLKDNVVLTKEGSLKIGDNTSLTNGNATINKVVVDGDHGTITGLSNQTWEVGVTKVVDGRAATENQLKALETGLIDKGLRFTGNNGKENKQKLNTLVKVIGERDDGQKEYLETASAKNNIIVEADEKDTLTVKLAKNLKNITSISNSNDINGTMITLGERQEVVGGVYTKVKTVDVDGAKIANVAEGTQDTDAVNVAQLNKLNSKIDKNSHLNYTTDTKSGVIDFQKNEVLGILGDGEVLTYRGKENKYIFTELDEKGNVRVHLTDKTKETLGKADTAMQSFRLQANGADETTIENGDRINFNDAKNTNVKKDGNTILVNVNESLKDMKDISGQGTTISFTDKGLSLNNRKITNIAKGTDSTDAVNKEQLDEAKTAATTKVDKLDENVVVKAENNEDGSTTYKVGLANKLSIGKEGTSVSLDGEKGTLNVGKKVLIDGTTGAASFDRVVIKGNAGTIGGLTNKEWNPETIVSGQAATEDQLKVLDKKIQDNTEDLVNRGMDFSGNDYDEKNEKTKIHKKLGERLEIIGGLEAGADADSKNLRTRVTDDGKLELLMSKNAGFTTVTTGNTILSKDGLFIKNEKEEKNVSLTDKGLNNGGNKITNLAAGTHETDAVNKAQLDKAQAAATTKLKEGKNISVTSEKGEDGSTTYTVAMKDTITLGTEKNKKIVADGTTGKLSIGDKIHLDGTTGNADFGKVKVNGENGEITGLTNTTTKGESFAKVGRAATEEQLKEVQDNVTTKIDNLSTELTDKGMNFVGNSGGTVHKKLGETLAVKGSGNKADDQYSSENIKTRVQNGELEIMLDKHVIVDTLTAKEGLDIIGKPGKDGKNTEAKISVKEGAAGVAGKDGENMDRIVYKDSKNMEHTLATHDDGMKYGGDIGESMKKQLNETVNVRGGITDADKLSKEANIGVVSDGKDNLTIRLAKDIKDLSSVTLLDPSGNKTVIHGEGVTIISKDGKEIKLSNKGLDNGGNKITNVAAGTESNDAVNVGQLNEVKEVINNHATAISNNTKRIEKMHGDMRRGFANAAAMSTLKFMEIGMNQATVGAAIGTYKGNQAVAVGVQTAPTENVRVHANVSIAPSREQVDTMAGIGASWRFNLK
ncbi:hypothetical protein EPT53_03360 [Fusobacterium necrophorum]|uniref:YadA-like C-terminal domain protein n=2 Tax=Bacteria TaxID=2 RepID=A0A4Q2L2N6_9FUSO|nr:YadA-like family protein [Fusobacterium necrophorum]RXZ70542.1 hypothetical protein EPT53_03360 [Fusobacterium necrophorum]